MTMMMMIMIVMMMAMMIRNAYLRVNQKNKVYR